MGGMNASAVAGATGAAPSRPDAARFPLRFGDWSAWRALLAAGIGVVLVMLSLPQMLGGTVGSLVLPSLGVDLDSDVYGPSVSFVEKSVLVLLGMVLIVVFARPHPRSTMGLRAERWVRAIAYGVAGAVIINLVLKAFEAVLGAQGATIGQQLAGFGAGTSLTADICLILAICVLGPVGEELLFRGIVHKGVRDGLHTWIPRWLAIAIATAVSSALFASLHLDPEQVGYLPVYVVFGLVCALAYELTGSLLAPVVAHVANNSYAVFGGAISPDVTMSSPAMVVLVVLCPVIGIALTLALGALLGDRPVGVRTMART